MRLIDEILSDSNIDRAILQVKRNKGVSGRGCGCQCGNLPQSVRTWCDTDTGVEKGLYFPWISEEIH